MREWFDKNGGWPKDAPLTETQSGGLHLYFRNDHGSPLGNSAGAFHALAIDVKGAGGQVIAPGAIRADGKRYIAAKDAPGLIESMLNGTIPMLPDAVKKAIGARRQGASVTSLDEEREARTLRESAVSFDSRDEAALFGFDLDELAAKNDRFAELLRERSGDHSADRFKLAMILRAEYGERIGVADYGAILDLLNSETDGAFGEHVEGAPTTGQFNDRAIAREFLNSTIALEGARSDGAGLGAVDDGDDAPLPEPTTVEARLARYNKEFAMILVGGKLRVLRVGDAS